MDLNTASFETERLFVRACTPTDASALTSLMTPEISKWVAAWPTPLTEEQAEEVLCSVVEAANSGSVFGAVVIEAASGTVIGWCKLDLDGAEAELGYWIGEDFHRQGFAFELSQGATEFAFEQLGVDLVRAGAQIENQASLALIKKLGMSREGVQRVWAPARQRFEDCEFWLIWRDDWRSGI